MRKNIEDYRSGGWVAKRLMTCKITTPNSDYYVASIYHPPDPVYDASELLDLLSHPFDQILFKDPDHKIIIARNINQLKIREFILQHALKQMVRACTREERMLDVLLTNYPFLWNEGRVHKGQVDRKSVV